MPTPDGPRYELVLPTRIDPSVDWTAAVVGDAHRCGLRADGSLWCWGRNSWGQVGNDRFDDFGAVLSPLRIGAERWLAVAAGDNHSCAIRDEQSLWCWGNNDAGQVGSPFVGEDTAEVTPLQVGDGNDWQTVIAGGNVSCAINGGGRAWCWGSNRFGQLGTVTDLEYSWQPRPLAPTLRWSQLSLGSAHLCGITNDGALWCWGLNHFGQLGTGDSSAGDLLAANSHLVAPQRIAPDRRWQAVAAGGAHTCAISDGDIYCWGRNHRGQAGLPQPLDAMPHPTRVAFPDAAPFLLVAAGQDHSCAIDQNHRLRCWGSNRHSQLGALAAPLSER